MSGVELLRVSDLRKRFGRARPLDGVSLVVRRGELVALTGENGAGKSTLLHVVCGVIEADEGEVVIAGEPLGRSRRRALAGVGFVPERGDAPGELLAAEWLSLVASLRGAPAASRSLLASLGVDALLQERLGALSLGQHRRVMLCAARLGDPPLLVLDEPTNGLDAGAVEAIAAAQIAHAAAGGGVLFASHDARFTARLSARVVRLSGGQIAS
jgi:ABC-2 type transport system ATP-binding protein